jgi:hypothetical protein
LEDTEAAAIDAGGLRSPGLGAAIYGRVVQDKDGPASLPGSRGIALVLPMLLSIANSIAVWVVVAEGRRCDDECVSGLLAVPAPLMGPFALVGVGDAARLARPGATALAGLVVIVTVFAWWSTATSRLAVRAGGSMPRFFGLYFLLFVGLCVKNSAVLAVADGPMLWPVVVLELVLAAVVLWRLAPRRPVNRPVSP